MNIVTKIRVNSWSNSLCALMPLWICPFSSTNVEDSLQINLFMQNKPNFRKSQMNVNFYSTKDYENKRNWTLGQNKPNSNPIKPNLKKAQMNANDFITKDYRKKDDFVVRINKPNLVRRRRIPKMNVNAFLQKDYENEPPSGPKKTNPNKPNLVRRRRIQKRPKSLAGKSGHTLYNLLCRYSLDGKHCDGIIAEVY